MIKQITDKDEKSQITKNILTQLPDWFGMPEGIEEYSKNCRDMVFWAYAVEDKIVGFLALGETSPYTLEINVMGVTMDNHGKGIGKELYNVGYEYGKNNNYAFLQVKTVKEGTYEEYDKTIAFYKAVGFREFECITQIWDEANPCQIFVKHID